MIFVIFNSKEVLILIRQFFFLFLISTSIAQTEFVNVELIDKTLSNVDEYLGTDKFGSRYFINDNILYKTTENDTINYSNYQLGNITTVNIFNTLKINLFYKDFNTAIILDNRLSEVFKIDFNLKKPYKNVSHISTGFDNTLWIFNQDLQVLELYNYKTNKTVASTLPIQSQVLEIASNYNYCWLLTESFLYIYNYQGSMISKMKNDGFTNMRLDNGNLILKKGDFLFFLDKEKDNLLKINTPELPIKQFSLTNETLYIYGLNFLYQFQLKL